MGSIDRRSFIKKSGVPTAGALVSRPMKYFFSLILIWIAFASHVQSQNASITEQKMRMETYMFSDPDPVPDMKKNYPYFKFDGFTNSSTQQEWNMVILENDHIKVYVNTDIGGKIWGAIEKSTGGEFLYFNDVVKFRDVAQRGPWTSGGLEYNFGIMGHVSTCSTPQDYVLKENGDGSVSCVIGAMDLHTHTKWNVEVKLPKDKAFVETTASWFNSGNLPVPYYHFMNAAAKADGNLEFLFPGSHYIGHGGEVSTWPVENGRDISFYENNDFGTYKSYHVLNSYSNFMGGYWHDDGFGFGHMGTYDDMPGKKLWIWGLAEEGSIWVDQLTDTNGQYIEFQSGKTFNQAGGESSLTPFKHREFIPYDADITTELWFPLKGTGGMVAASEYAVLNVVEKEGNLEIIISALQEINTSLRIDSEGETVGVKRVVLGPLELFTTKIEIDTSNDFLITLGDEMLTYSSKKEDLIVERPLEPNPDFDWNSAIGLYTKGLELEKQQSNIPGGTGNQTPHDLYLQSLGKDPAYAPALNRLAFSSYRRMDYLQALHYTLKSLAIDTYDDEANYLFGLINTRLHNHTSAKSGFSIAVQSPLYRTAAYTELARLYLLEKKFSKAAAYAQKALAFNQYNVVALEMLALVYRQQGKPDRQHEVLDKLHELDATSSFVKYEKILAGDGDVSKLSHLITNELAFESYLQLGIKFYNYGLPEETIEILKAAPRQATVFLWLAFLDIDHRQEWLKSALEISPDLVFPYRDETFVVLDSLMKTESDWKLKYYASMILWKKGVRDQAEELFQQCGDQPDYAPFYLAKAKFFENDANIKKAALLRAESLDKENWRVNLALVEQYIADKEYDLAARYAQENLNRYPERSILGVTYAGVLLHQGKYEKCIAFLESFEIIPFEGAVMGRSIYHEAAVKAAFEKLKSSHYKNAIDYANKALLWPSNLGSGKPYVADERVENYIIAYCYGKLGKDSEADAYYTKFNNHQTDEQQVENSLLNELFAILDNI